MELRSRTRQKLRRAITLAALGTLIVPATAGAAAKTPVIKKVSPKTASVGTKLVITGKHFKRGKGTNSVLFRRDKGKALFVKSDVSTTKRLTVVVPKKLEKYMKTTGGKPVPTRFRLRVMAAKLSKRYTPKSRSPLIGPEKIKAGTTTDGAGVPSAPDGDCDGDGIKNRDDADDDNDLLPDTLELALLLDPCSKDTDKDGVEDGFEYQSAIDLNNDDYQSPNVTLPFPGKTPYPNPLYADADVDYDGDSLTLSEEYNLWKYTYEVGGTATRTLHPLSYSDGHQYSLSTLVNGRRKPTQSAADYPQAIQFREWAEKNGYGNIRLFHLAPGDYDIFDIDRSGGLPTTVPTDFQHSAERYYYDHDGDGYISDDERDEDADGLTNYLELHGPLTAGWWAACYSAEGEYPIKFAGTSAWDEDTDGDGIRDGADDQDFDDVPNVMEYSRNMASNRPLQGPGNCSTNGITDVDPLAPAWSWVNPFNPCLPDPLSRSCPRHPQIGAGYAPFLPDWKPYILN
jgi:hypothetical protein